MVGRNHLMNMPLNSKRTLGLFVLGIVLYGLAASYPYLWFLAVPLELLGLVIVLFGQVNGKTPGPLVKTLLLVNYRVLIILSGTPWLVGSFSLMYPKLILPLSVIACYFVGYIICAGLFLSYIPLKLWRKEDVPWLQFLWIFLLMIIWEYGVYLWPASSWLSLGFLDSTVKVFYFFGHNGTKFIFILMKTLALWGLLRGFLNFPKVVAAVTFATAFLIGIAQLIPSQNYSSDRHLSFSLIQEGKYSVHGQPLNVAMEIVDRVKVELKKDPADIVVWPENFFVGDEKLVNRILQDLQKEVPAQHVAGSTGFTPHSYRSTVDSIFEGHIQHQSKGTAFPVGEYTPLLDTWKKLGLLPETHLNIETSWGYEVFPTKYNDVKFLGLVCLDAFNPWLISYRVSQIKDRAEKFFLVEIYNETLFGTERAARQHLALMRVMAASFRMPMIHAGQAGISAILNADGSTQTTMPYGENGILKGQLFF